MRKTSGRTQSGEPGGVVPDDSGTHVRTISFLERPTAALPDNDLVHAELTLSQSETGAHARALAEAKLAVRLNPSEPLQPPAPGPGTQPDCSRQDHCREQPGSYASQVTLSAAPGVGSPFKAIKKPPVCVIAAGRPTHRSTRSVPNRQAGKRFRFRPERRILAREPGAGPVTESDGEL